MSATIKNKYGSIVICDNVIAALAAESAQETYGIVGLVAQNTKDGLFELLKFEKKTKGVKVTINNNVVDIDLSLMLEFGVRISVVAENLIEKVKYNIEKNTKLKVNSVNIVFQRIRL